MLQFFRKYQKFFFLFTTVIIVTSFAFFGTYQAFAPGFKGGHTDGRSYTGQMADFLNTEQWMVSHKVFAANFLNDGVISKEFLETGMAALVAEKYAEYLQPDFATRFEKEKGYTPYTHPFQPLLSAESVWSMFAPDLSSKLQALQHGNGGFEEKCALFLAQKQFPPAFFSQVIRYQEQNNPQIPQDPRLAKEDISLFGYNGMSDWFGEGFVESIADIIVQTAGVARKLGFKASKDELLADLVYRSQETYNGLKQRVNLPVEDGYGLFQLYLRQTGLSEATVLKIWEDVTLFRRLMHEVGDAAVVDSLPLEQFYRYAYENVTVELYQMPREFRFQSLEDLKRFESYLAAVSERRSSPSDLPFNYASISTIEQRAPEVVGKRYELYFSKVSKQGLQSKVSVKETLEWECDPQNWGGLQKQFPELAQKTGAPFDSLEILNPKARKLVDIFARKQIVEKHPEWIQEALFEMQMEEKELFLSSVSEKPFKGITDVKAFIQSIDTEDELIGYTQDDRHYYRFLIQERGEAKELLTYKEALKAEGLLDKLKERMEADQIVQRYVDTLNPQDQEKAHLLRFADYITQYKGQSAEGDLIAQFPIEKKHKTITRSERSFISLDEVLSLEEGEFSNVRVDPSEGAFVYRFLESKSDKTVPMDKMVQSQELLSKEARCRYFEKLLTQL